MSEVIITETVIKPEIVNTIIQPIITETPIEVGDINQVIGLGGSFMLDDGTKVTIIEAADPDPAITQIKELLIRKNS